MDAPEEPSPLPPSLSTGRGNKRRSTATRDELLARYRRIRSIIFVSIAVILLAVFAAQLSSNRGDYRRFNQKRFTVTKVVDGDTFELADGTRVALLGVDAPDLPDMHYAAASAGYLRGRTEGKVVLLKLDGTQTRDADNRLLAYVYLTDTNLLNIDIIRDGRAYSDRRVQHTYRPQFDQAENESRNAARGLWDEISDDKLPAWRRAWLKSLRRD